MKLLSALVIWLIIVILVYIIARNFRIQPWSAFILAILIGAIVLGILVPITSFNMFNMNGDISTGLYTIIMFLTPLLVLVYVITKAVTDTT